MIILIRKVVLKMICLNCGCKNELGAKFCAHCGAPTALANSDQTGKIIVNREKKTLAFAISFEVWIDDTKLGTLKNGGSLSTNISYGPHEIKLTSTEKDVLANVEINDSQKVATVTVTPKMGLIAAKPNIKEIKYTNE